MLHSPTFTYSNHRITTTHQNSPKFCIILCLHYSFLLTLPHHFQCVPIFHQMIQTTCVLCHPEKMTNPLTLRLSHPVRHSHQTHQTIPKKEIQPKLYEIQLVRETVDCRFCISIDGSITCLQGGMMV